MLPPSLRLAQSRREFLYVGMMGGVAGGLGLTLPSFLASTARAQPGSPAKAPVAQSVIHIFLPGGLSAQESFDPKPLAPIEYRGPLGTVATWIARGRKTLTERILSEERSGR